MIGFGWAFGHYRRMGFYCDLGVRVNGYGVKKVHR